MNTKLYNEDELLNEKFRAGLIKEITETENVERKKRELRKYEVYRDRTKQWVIQALFKQFNVQTVSEMESRATNISIARKIVDKLARAYNGGVIRELENKADTQKVNDLAEFLLFDQKMKKIDRYEHLFRNTLLGVLPEKDSYLSDTLGKDLFNIRLKPLVPFTYDVVPDYINEMKAKCVILTDFVERNQTGVGVVVADNSDGRVGVIADFRERGDRREQTIANSPEDKGTEHRRFIFWSNKYHFTTDDKGQIIGELSPENNLNPIGILPFINFSHDQDCSFWADGGDDLTDGSVLINVLITDLFSIANQQGWGQPVATGKNLKDKIVIGPHRVMILEHETDDPTPSFQFVSANPPIADWMRMIEMYTALLLSTNNLSPRNISGSLDVNNIASGISKLIDESESTESIEESQERFRKKEPLVWDIFKKWYDVYDKSKSLIPELAEFGTLQSTDVNLIFKDPKPVVTEDQKLQNIKLRKELGINTMLELIKIDNPFLKEDEALAKLESLKAEKMSAINQMVENAMQNKNVASNNKPEEIDEPKEKEVPKQLQ